MSNIDPGKTVALEEQLRLITDPNNERLGSKKFKFFFEFGWRPNEIELAKEAEKEEKRYQYVNSKGYFTYEDTGRVDKFTGYTQHIYQAKVNLTVPQAAALLGHYGIDLVVRSQYTYKGKDFPREAEKGEETRGGAITTLPALPEPESLGHMQGTATIMFSHHFDIRPEYLPGKVALKEEFVAVRKRLWHEIMETTLIALVAEALYMPRQLHSDYKRKKLDNFANESVKEVQRGLRDSLFLYWEGDPPFDGFEVGPMSKENELEQRENHLHGLKSFYIPEKIARMWEDIAKEWEVVAQAWLYTKSPHRIKKATTAWEKAANAWYAAEGEWRRSTHADKDKLADASQKRGQEAERKAKDMVGR
ncbi:MAG: hypothetical protein E3J71_04450 [Candidatus Stahlbacteria bacterium]|nr:MAG: hypothetical protein E3J71_04450 [Candidatus Stahlbacteria bacterium]